MIVINAVLLLQIFPINFKSLPPLKYQLQLTRVVTALVTTSISGLKNNANKKQNQL